MKHVVLSVIVANQNNERFIRECLDSVLAQTFKDFEIIISDDCSTDSSPAIIREYEKKNPRIVKGIFSAMNMGVARTRHEAILEAGAEYIVTLDSDDYYHNTLKLEKEMELVSLYKEKTGEDIMAYSNIAQVTENKTSLGLMGNSKNLKEGMIVNEILGRSCMIPRDFVMKKSAYFDVGGYDPGLSTHEDWDLKIRLAARFNYYYTRRSGISYRRHAGGLSALPHPIRTENLWKVFQKNIHLIPTEEKQAVTTAFTSFMAKREELRKRTSGNQP